VSSERLRSFFHVLCTSAVIDCIYPQRKKLKQIFASLEKKAPHGFRGSHVLFYRNPFDCCFRVDSTSFEHCFLFIYKTLLNPQNRDVLYLEKGLG
jgi:hypothetical protein